MFGKNMMEQLQKMQAGAAESKKKLDEIIVHGESGGNLIHIEMTGNRKLKKLTINTELSQIDKGDLEDLLAVALNRAIEAADKVNEQEMANAAKGIIPGM
jgi:DNA-binding YbaB/EbfC family protein